MISGWRKVASALVGYAKEYHIERLWREARLLRLAPISPEMVLNFISTSVLGLPRSY